MAATPSPGHATEPARRPSDPAEAHQPWEAASPEATWPGGVVPLPGLALPVRTSLRVGAVNDPAELEAESVAELVVEALRRSPVTSAGRAEPARHVPTQDEPSGPVRRAAVVGAEGGDVDGSAASSIEQLRGGGQPLPDGIRRSMESAFGTDLSGVRVHTGPTAARLNDHLGAHAFTTGNDIAFADGLPDVTRPDGQRLMAHELTHVLQHRGTDTLSALRRQAATVARHAATVARQATPVRVRLGTVSFVSQPRAEPADSAATAVRRVFKVAVGPSFIDDVVYIESVVISDRPKNPDTSGMKEQGGKSFHHESAWTWVERRVTQFEGKPLQDVVNRLVKYGIDPVTMPKLDDPGADAVKQLAALNAYFHNYLESKAKQARGWLGPTGSHSSQGGKVSGAIRSLQSSGWTEQNIVNALNVSFDPGPDVEGMMLWLAAQAHADAFYDANQLLLEAEGPSATIDLAQHREILDILYDWDSGYWEKEYEESDDVEVAEEPANVEMAEQN